MDKDKFALETEIHNLDDLIEARREKSGPEDEFDEDVKHPQEDVDPNEALTFPHPKHKHEDEVELMGQPHESDMDEDWDAQDIQPSDYEHRYDEATDAHASDDEDEIAEEHVHEIGHVSLGDVQEAPTEVPQHNFAPDEESAA